MRDLNIEKHVAEAKKTALTSLLANTGFAISKGIAGVLGNSFALTADAIESLTDVFSSILVFLGIQYAVRPADDNHPYGHGKIEPLITFIIVGFLVSSSVTITYHAIENINSEHVKPEKFTIFVLLIVIIIKELLYRFVEKKGEETQSTSLQAEAWHHRSDAISSAVALIGILISIYGNYNHADDYAAIVTAIIILFNAYLIFRPAIGEIMDEHLHLDLEDEIRINTKKHFPETETEKIYIRKNGMLYHVDLHLIVDGNISVHDGHELAHKVKRELMKMNENIGNILIHVEPKA